MKEDYKNQPSNPDEVPYLIQPPEGFTVNGANVVCVEQYDPHANLKAEAEFEIVALQTLQPVNRLVLETEAIDKMTIGYIPVTLLG